MQPSRYPRFRRLTLTDQAQAELILAEGEAAFDRATGTIVVGDGVTQARSLVRPTLLAVGKYYERSGSYTDGNSTTTDTFITMALDEPTGGVFADDEGWYDAGEEALLLPAGQYQFALGFSGSATLGDPWLFQYTFIGYGGSFSDELVFRSEELTGPAIHAGSVFQRFFPEPCWFQGYAHRGEIDSVTFKPQIRIEQLYAQPVDYGEEVEEG